MRVKPAPGFKLRCPETGALLSEEDEIEVRRFTKYYHYWRRRLRDGDAVLVSNEDGGRV